MGVIVPDVMRTLLTDRSKEYMKAKVDRMSLVGGDEAWEGAKPAMEAIGLLLKEKGGPFVLGETGKSYHTSSSSDQQVYTNNSVHLPR